MRVNRTKVSQKSRQSDLLQVYDIRTYSRREIAMSGNGDVESHGWNTRQRTTAKALRRTSSASTQNRSRSARLSIASPSLVHARPGLVIRPSCGRTRIFSLD